MNSTYILHHPHHYICNANDTNTQHADPSAVSLAAPKICNLIFEAYAMYLGANKHMPYDLA